MLRGGRPRRSFLYVPAHNPRYIEKALTSVADCIVLDLEDGVAESEKDLARRNIQSVLQRLSSEGYRAGENSAAELCVRVNSEGWLEKDAWGDVYRAPQAPSKTLDRDLDLLALPEAGGITVVLPKANSPSDILNVQKVIVAKRALAHGDAVVSRDIAVIPIFETAHAMVSLPDFAKSCISMPAIVFAAEDYCASLGIPRLADFSNMLYARSAVVNLCKMLGITPIDMVCQDYTDKSILERECNDALGLGFEGKQVVHPGQIETVNKSFAPSPETLAYSRRVLAAMQQQPQKGAFELEGKMVDKPVFRKAEDICALHEGFEEYERRRFVA
ncbi:hypothetical protein DRE_01086 [Drechslerella stenobrocha 248]|uniref:HpcH/HpaI aldolase/citrate lyase domain-containing protein n=1 Tax=Drechslerella stenobrocha 248 TaxID=1043628 RepID=W7I671_9PEZI|nr:hypothetical protein DRE_01086 [Drechslerella stenobrocha 248]